MITRRFVHVCALLCACASACDGGAHGMERLGVHAALCMLCWAGRALMMYRVRP